MIKKMFAVVVALGLLVGMSGMVYAAQKKEPKSADDLFARADKNGDKKVSPEEFVGKATGEKATKAKTRFERMDANHDGFLTLDEYKAAASKGKRKKDS